uniref:Putative group i salivary lipocalin n=1 Tax=Rhipicephalus pulchellus TaxID=72859 RepID=L7M8H1_RHIPC
MAILLKVVVIVLGISAPATRSLANEVQEPASNEGQESASNEGQESASNEVNNFYELWTPNSAMWKYKSTDMYGSICEGYHRGDINRTGVYLRSSAWRDTHMSYGNSNFWRFGPKNSMSFEDEHHKAIEAVKAMNPAKTCAVVVSVPWWVHREKQKQSYEAEQRTKNVNCTVLEQGEDLHTQQEEDCLYIKYGKNKYLFQGEFFYYVLLREGIRDVPHDCDNEYKKIKGEKTDRKLYDPNKCKPYTSSG